MDAVELAFISALLLMALLAVSLMTVLFVFVCDFGDWFANMINRHGRR